MTYEEKATILSAFVTNLQAVA